LTSYRKRHAPTIFHETGHLLGLYDRYSHKTGRKDEKFGPDLMNDMSASFSQVHIENLAGFALFYTHHWGGKDKDGKVYIRRYVDRSNRKLVNGYRPFFGEEGEKSVETITPPLIETKDN